MRATCASCKHTEEFTPPPASAAFNLPTCPRCFSTMYVHSEQIAWLSQTEANPASHQESA